MPTQTVSDEAARGNDSEPSEYVQRAVFKQDFGAQCYFGERPSAGLAKKDASCETDANVDTQRGSEVDVGGGQLARKVSDDFEIGRGNAETSWPLQLDTAVRMLNCERE